MTRLAAWRRQVYAQARGRMTPASGRRRLCPLRPPEASAWRWSGDDVCVRGTFFYCMRAWTVVFVASEGTNNNHNGG